MVNAKKHLRPATLTMVLDIDKRIRMMTQYPSATGRNFYETIRAIDTMQLHLYHQVYCHHQPTGPPAHQPTNPPTHQPTNPPTH